MDGLFSLEWYRNWRTFQSNIFLANFVAANSIRHPKCLQMGDGGGGGNISWESIVRAFVITPKPYT